MNNTEEKLCPMTGIKLGSLTPPGPLDDKEKAVEAIIQMLEELLIEAKEQERSP